MLRSLPHTLEARDTAILFNYRAPDLLGALIAVGITALIALQVVINIAVVTGTIPVTGMPLPFFSSGGTALIFTLGEMGVLLNISCQGKKVAGDR